MKDVYGYHRDLRIMKWVAKCKDTQMVARLREDGKREIVEK